MDPILNTHVNELVADLEAHGFEVEVTERGEQVASVSARGELPNGEGEPIVFAFDKVVLSSGRVI